MDNEKAQNPIMQFFTYSHLPYGGPKEVGKLCSQLATTMEYTLPRCAETSAGLRKLLEAKDCFVRAAITQTT